ncbi:MAG: NAD(P)-binding domain-containing protein [bacterium]|nr:NAD(P)-binding domain-containing protein [bacterium]
MSLIEKLDTYCIIGAGSSGITAGKNFKERGIPFDIVEREDEIGGNWYYGKPNSSVYKSTHLISSKTMTAYTDYAMPDDYPHYPSHQQVCDYLRSYARHFGLYPHIAFNTSVENITRMDEGYWDVQLSNGETRRYAGVVICNGHNWDPKFPSYPGTFDGLVLHSAEYKTPDVLAGKRVLVVGAGNSGCDIVVEAAQNAEKTFHSTRRGYWYVPKYAFGRPADVINETPIRLGLPVWARRVINGAILNILVGDFRNYGLRKPDHKLLQTHPIINQHILYYMGHGMITPKPDVAELCGDSVKFKDGTVEPIDVIIYATGFNITFKFIDQKYLNWNKTHPDLYINVFHPQYDNLFCVGLIQPDSGQFWIADLQSQLIASFIAAAQQGSPAADEFRRLKATERPDLGGGIRYLESTRHYLEIEHGSYRARIKKLLKLFEKAPAVAGR